LSYFILMCLISQGSKGVYPTILKGVEASKTHYATDSGSYVLGESRKSKTLLRISKKQCRILSKVKLTNKGEGR